MKKIRHLWNTLINFYLFQRKVCMENRWQCRIKACLVHSWLTHSHFCAALYLHLFPSVTHVMPFLRDEPSSKIRLKSLWYGLLSFLSMSTEHPNNISYVSETHFCSESILHWFFLLFTSQTFHCFCSLNSGLGCFFILYRNNVHLKISSYCFTEVQPALSCWPCTEMKKQNNVITVRPHLSELSGSFISLILGFLCLIKKETPPLPPKML